MLGTVLGKYRPQDITDWGKHFSVGKIKLWKRQRTSEQKPSQHVLLHTFKTRCMSRRLLHGCCLATNLNLMTRSHGNFRSTIPVSDYTDYWTTGIGNLTSNSRRRISWGNKFPLAALYAKLRVQVGIIWSSLREHNFSCVMKSSFLFSEMQFYICLFVVRRVSYGSLLGLHLDGKILSNFKFSMLPHPLKIWNSKKTRFRISNKA